jgi:predicted nucleic acid-binding protein
LHRLSLPDAVILATAHAAGWPLLTRNTRDFEALPGVVVPYYFPTTR